jgi:hypothetical protein
MCYLPCVWCIVSETLPRLTCNYGEKYFMAEDLREILQNSSDEEYIEDEREEDREERNVQNT